ncbi:MAG: murein L,D-transpeptidase catalytic domain family protein [Rikenellaceae bacterium]
MELHIKKLLGCLIVLLLLTFSAQAASIDSLYEVSHVSKYITYRQFCKASERYEELEPTNKILTLIDFSLASTQKRMYVVDMQSGELLYHCHVAHGQGSGGNYATKFSNKEGSHQSSLGFYRTLDTYTGHNGYSLRLEGLDKGINDNAYKRAIVIHGAEYANPENISRYGGRLGRSWGCPALPTAIAKEIINTIKNGSIIYIFAE